MHFIRRAGRCLALPLILIAALAGCTVQLSPDFDQRIADDLGAANEQVHVLLETAAAAPSAAGYPGTAGTYAAAIGKVRATALLVRVRPVPQLSARGQETLRARGLLPPVCDDTPGACIAPTPGILDNVAKVLETMRDTHRAGGLTDTRILQFAALLENELSLAVAFETALER
ncbi:hypothetical protein [Mangrovicoccus sp. HB161399]|uniref:hypothetical protein n=1 Tax=Mangrovicoccus sp. HB161399 TaxID=2720392 RepID=UPI00155291FA|nr:hypothetical protein [Mangrovicoccus sp. HB161399]